LPRYPGYSIMSARLSPISCLRGSRMKRSFRVPLALALFSSMACFHAVITTGRAESSTVVEQEWAKSWVAGLVPPDVMDVSKQCASGVAKVETQHSFLNLLVQWLTIDIFSPMDIKVTCAGAGMAPKTSMITPSENTPAAERNAMAQAVERADRTGEAVFVRF
jgi:hypothetical protein